MGRTRYSLDAKSSHFTVQTFAEGLAGIADHRPMFSIREFDGKVEFDPDRLDGSLHLSARSGSLAIVDEVTKHDRQAIEKVMFGEVLRPEVFPEVVFRSSRVACSAVAENRYRVDITGTVSLRGVENQEAMQVQLVVSEDSMRAYGEFRLRQSNYGIPVASVAGGMLRIRDELKFVFFLVGRNHNGA